MKSNQDCTEFDARYAESAGEEVVGPLAEYYFRLKVIGLENLPHPEAGGPSLIFMANHAGRCLPWDAILLDYAISRHWRDNYGIGVQDKPRSLAAPALSHHPMLLPFRLKNWWQRMGCVDATARNFQKLVKAGKPVIIFPEGIPGIGRDFKDRYQLLPFATSVVRIAARNEAMLVPVSIIGSEHFHPYANRSRLTDFIAEKLKLPFLHLSPFVFLPILGTWFFYMALPAPVTIVIGEPFALENPDTLNNEAAWEIETEKLREMCQEQINEARLKYEHGWQWLGLVKSLLSAPEPFWKYLPFAWPYRFINHARRKGAHLFPETVPPWQFLVSILAWLTPLEPKEEKLEQQEKPYPLPVPVPTAY